MPGKSLQSVWTDVPRISNTSAERLGYPTQKPLALLERIIRASTDEGGVVLDPFCGCGTTIEAAQRLNRQWIGIDIAVHSIKVIEARLRENFGDVVRYTEEGIPKDFESAARLASQNKYQFQWWANYLFNPHTLREQKKGKDRGVDGELFFPNGPGKPWGRMLTSVKGGENVGPAMVRDFAGALAREKADMGLFICLHRPTREMIKEAAAAGIASTIHGRIPKLQIVAIEDWFENKLPQLPPLEHLPSAALSTSRRRLPETARPNPDQPELPLSFVGGKGKSVVHVNRKMTSEAAA
jgi:site-specific DNA-methyltransferase (adenine-specific)